MGSSSTARMEKIALILLGLAALCHCEIHFKEEFADDTWEQRWVYSTNKGSDAGKFKLTAGKFYADKIKDQGIKTSQDAKFYQLSTKIEKPFSNKGKSLVLQYTVKHEQGIDCGGGYIKLFPADIDPATMNGDTPYNVMFGPDICGPGTKKVHVIFNYKGKNLLTKKDIRCKDDELTHLYTLILNSDNTYEVQIDGSKVESGKLEDDWDFLAPKTIKDPEATKPSDWDDRAKIDDPDDKKPEDWDNEPELIPDPEAKKPEDWDDEEDGDWEPAMINNPAYKGEWVHPEIPNPEYVEDANLYLYESTGAVGFEIWQVKAGTIFDNILVTDDIEEAKAHAKETFEVTKEGEKKMKDEADEKERKEEEEREKKRKEEEKDKKDDDKDDKEEEPEEEEEEEEKEEPAAAKDEL